MKRSSVVLLIFLSLGLLITTYCSKKNPSEPTTENETIIAENVEILVDSTIQELHHQEGDSLFYFNLSATEVLELQTGDIILSSDGEGFLRKIKSIEQEGDYIIVETDFTSLEDVITKGEISTHLSLSPEKMNLKYLKKGVTISPNESMFEIDLDAVIYKDPSTGAEVRIYGSSSFETELDLDVHWNLGVDYLRFQASVFHNQNLGVEISKGLSVEGSILLASFILSPQVIQVGPVPIVIVPQIDIYAGANVSANARLNSAITVNDTLVGGVLYESGDWSSFSDYGVHFGYQPPSVSIAADVEGYCVVPDISLKIYMVTGPAVRLKGYSKIHVDPYATPWWVLSAGINAGAGIKADILAWHFAWWATIYEHEWEIANSGNNRPPNNPSIPTGPSIGTVGNTYTFSTSATDPDEDNVQIRFVWTTGDTSTWSNAVSSGSSTSMSHSWATAGTYSVKAQAKDVNGAYSGWSNGYQIVISGGGNNPPNTPSIPSGPSSGTVGNIYSFSSSVTDPEGDNVQIRFVWNNVDTSSWSPMVSSGTSTSMSHSWSIAGTYSVKAQAKDSHGMHSALSNGHQIIINGGGNNPPNTPSVPIGPSSGNAGNSYSLSTSATDPDGDNLQIQFAWGDGDTSAWSSIVPSGHEISMSYSWSNDGIYHINARARDIHGAYSGWSSEHIIFISSDENSPPLAPSSPAGPNSGSIGHSYIFSAFSSDADGDDIRIRFTWSNDDTSDWSSWIASGCSLSVPHQWINTGTYYVKAQAQDIKGAYSPWSNSHTIQISEVADYPNHLVTSIPVGMHATGMAVLPNGDYLYVANLHSNTVSVIKTDDFRVVATIHVEVQPQKIASLPNGEYIYLVNSHANVNNNVSVIRTSDNQVVDIISIDDWHSLSGIAAHPNGNFVYVTGQLWPDYSVFVINTSDNTISTSIPLSSNGTMVEITPNGEYLYVTKVLEGTVSVINTEDNQIVDNITVGNTPGNIAVHPNGEYLYVCNRGGDNISVIRQSDNLVIDAISVGDLPIGIKVLPNGEYLYVACNRDNNVYVIDLFNNQVVDIISVVSEPHSIEIHPSGNYVYVSSFYETVCVIGY